MSFYRYVGYLKPSTIAYNPPSPAASSVLPVGPWPLMPGAVSRLGRKLKKSCVYLHNYLLSVSSPDANRARTPHPDRTSPRAWPRVRPPATQHLATRNRAPGPRSTDHMGEGRHAHTHRAWHADHTPSSQTEHCPAYTHMLNSHVHHLAHLPCPHATSLCEAVRTLALQSTLYRAAGREYSHPCTTVGEPSACKHPSLPSPRSPRRASARALRRPFWHPHAVR